MTWLLLRHELWLTWRGVRFGRFGVPSIPVVLLIVALAQVVGLSLGWTIMKAAPSDAAILAGTSAALLFMAGLMLAQALGSTMEALFERRDLEWLLTTPAPFGRVILLRMLAVSVGVAWPWLLFAGAVANGLAMMGRVSSLAAYPVLLAMALAAVSAASLLAAALVAVAGVAWARGIAITLAMAVGALGFLAGQYQTLLSPAQQAAVWAGLLPSDRAPAILWWPARAAFADPGPLLAILVCSAGLGLLAARLVSRRLVRVGASAPAARRSVPAGGVVRFRAGARAVLFWTELRLLRRSTGLLGQAAYPLVYMIPVAVAAWRGGIEVTGSAPVFVAGSIASVLMATAVGADEAAELVQTAPVPTALVMRAKILAASAMVAAILGGPVMAIGLWKPGLLPSMVAGCVCATLSGLLLGLWRPDEVRRLDLGSGQRAFRGVDFLQFCVSVAWSIAAALAVQAPQWAAVPAIVALALTLSGRPRRRGRY